MKINYFKTRGIMSNNGSALRPADEEAAPRVSREVLTAISGLIAGMFVALISSTVVSPSLPVIVHDLNGSQSDYTWIVTVTLLAMTVTTPILGKLSDLINRKILVQLSLVVFTIGSILSGFAPDTTWLIASRAVQGIGIGGLMALVQIVIADLISPRERGKYMGVIGAVMGVGTVAGPLTGGVITDSIGWEWNFWVFVPFSLAALVLIQKTLHLPKRPPRPVKIDYLGATLIAAGVITLLLWVSLAGTADAVAAGSKNFEWASTTTAWMVGGALLALALAVWVELKAAEPIIPMQLFKDRTFTLAVVSSIAVGVAMFGTSVFLAQYMQLARGATPTQSGLMTLPMIVGQMGGGIVIGQLISRSGKWKRYVVTGGALTILALALMGTIRYDTNFALVSVYMFLLGLGLGMVMQNVVLAVQNSVAAKDIGAASAGVTFFRSLGGTIGVSALGAVLSQRVPTLLQDGLAKLSPDQLSAHAAELKAMQSGALPEISSMAENNPIRLAIEGAYGQAIGQMFWFAVPLAVVAFIAIVFLPNKSLSRSTGAERLAAEASGDALHLAEATTANDSPESHTADLALTGMAPETDDDAAGRRDPGARG